MNRWGLIGSATAVAVVTGVAARAAAQPQTGGTGGVWLCSLVFGLPVLGLAAWIVYRFVSDRAAARRAAQFQIVRGAVADVGRGLRSPAEARALVEGSGADPSTRRHGIADGYVVATFDAIRDNVLSDAERDALRVAWDTFAPDPSDQRVIEANGAIAHAPAVAEILAHRVPRLASTAPAGLILQPDERLVWVIPAWGAEGTLQMRTSIRFDSIGIPIGDSVYFSAGAGQSITRLQHGIGRAGSGVLVFTTKHITFVGGSSLLRIPFSSIVRIVPADDGFIMQLDTDARPFFVVRLPNRADAWLGANLAANLPRIRA
jgi:hypothetical protein